MFLFVPGLSVAVKCSIIGGVCAAVAAAEALRARSVLESIKTKARSAFVFKSSGAAKPSEHSYSSQVAPEAESNDSPDYDNGIIKPSFATDDTVKCDRGNGSFISVPEDEDAVRSSTTLRSSAINVKMQALDRLSDEVVADGDPAAVKMQALERLSDEAVSDEVVADGDPAAVKMQALERLSDEAVVDVVVVVGTACGKLPLMPDLGTESDAVKAKVPLMADLGAESADVKAKAVHAAAIRGRQKNDRSWASRVFKGSRDFVRGCMKNARSWITRVFKETRDLVRGSLNRVRCWLGKMDGGTRCWIETPDDAVCARDLPEVAKNPSWILEGLKSLILDNQVILKKILLEIADFVVVSFCASRPGRKLLMRLYHLLRSELRW